MMTGRSVYMGPGSESEIRPRPRPAGEALWSKAAFERMALSSLVYPIEKILNLQ